MNHRLLSFLKGLFLIQCLIQCYNIYGLHIRAVYWPRVFFPLYIIFTTTIFHSFDEKKSQLLVKSKSTSGISLLDVCICFFISLLAMEFPPHFSLWSLLLQICSFIFYSSSLWLAHPYDILQTSHYFKLPLFESSVLLILYWSAYLTYFIAIYPPLALATQSHHPLLYEPLPLLLHIIFVHLIVVLWLAIMIYTHHRMQFIVDTRRCGVWIRCNKSSSSIPSHPSTSQPSSSSSSSSSSRLSSSSSSSSPIHKIPQWKSGHSYRYQDICIYDQTQYQLTTPFSSYSFPPSLTSYLPYKQYIYTVMNKESGPLSQSFVLTCLLQFLSIVGCSVIIVGLLYPRQQQIGFFLHGFILSILLYYYQKIFLSPRIVETHANGISGFQSSDEAHYIYHPYQSTEPSSDTTFPTLKGKNFGNSRARSASGSGGGGGGGIDLSTGAAAASAAGGGGVSESN